MKLKGGNASDFPLKYICLFCQARVDKVYKLDFLWIKIIFHDKYFTEKFIFISDFFNKWPSKLYKFVP